MAIGLLALLVVAALIYLGVAHRILDRMKLTDGQALLFIGAMIVGSFFNIPLVRGGRIALNLGGGVVPVALAVYLWATADKPQEKTRALLSTVITGGILYALVKLFVFEEGRTFIDVVYVFGIVAGVVSYITGRSRRAAFIGGVLGVLLLDIANLVEILVRKIPGVLSIGGAGVFDSIIIAGLIAVGLAEAVGETRERLGGGHAEEGDSNDGNE